MNTLPRLLILFVTVSMLMSATSTSVLAENQPSSSVLLLNSYHPGFSWSDEEEAGVVDRLRDRLPAIDIQIEYLDAKRHPEKRNLARMKNFLIDKYKGQTIDLIIALDDAALDMLSKYHTALFPDIPVVFAGIASFTKYAARGRQRITGVLERQNISATLDTALKLHQGTKEVLAISDTTASGISARRQMETIMSDYEGRVKIRLLPTCTFEEARAEVAALGPGALILLNTYTTDSSGTVLSTKKSTDLIVSAAKVPVYGVHQNRLGDGIVGGYLLSGREHGKSAADIGLRILAGGNPQAIAIMENGASQAMFDYQQMKRFGIPVSSLPEGSIVINRPESVFTMHRAFAITITAIFILLVIVVLCLGFFVFRLIKAKTELREKDKALRLSLDAAKAGTWTWDVNTDEVIFDDRLEKIFGLQPGTFDRTFQGWKDRVHPDDVQFAEQKTLEALNGGTHYECEYRVKGFSGDWRIVNAQAATMVDNSGKPVRMSGFATDITERKLAEEERQHALAMLEATINQSPAGILIADAPDVKIRMANPAAVSVRGKTEKELTGIDVAEHVIQWQTLHPDGSPYSPEKLPLSRAILNGEVTQGEEVIICNEAGEHRWVSANAAPVRNSAGEIVSGIVIMHDITERKQADDEIRHLRNYLSNIIDSMPSVLVGVDSQGRVTQWNKRAEQVTGRPSDQAIAQPLDRVFSRLEDQMSAIKTAIRERRVINTPKVSRKMEQETRYENIIIFPLVTNGVEGAVIRVDDVTEQVCLEEMMIQSEKMLSVGGLAAGMAHEVNNPLAGILQSVAVLQNRLLGDLPANRKAAETAGTTLAAIRHYLDLRKLPGMLENIRESGTRAAEIVKNMLSFSRKSDRMVTHQDLGVLLDRTLELVRTDYDMKKRYDVKQIRIEREYDPLVPPVPCEASKVQQVFMNILKNGAEAMADADAQPDPPTLVLRVCDDGDWVRVEIEDNGPGMDVRTRRRIFEPFYTTKPVGQGTGLGLSVAYFIITEDHGGEMAVESRPVGGTKFIIRLPKEGDQHLSDS